MTTATGRGPVPRWMARPSELARRHPEYGAALAAVVAWGVVVAWHAGRPPAGGHHGGLAGGPSAGVGSAAVAPATLGLWAVMCVAMMVPVALPAVHHVAANSLRWRRQRAVAVFLVAYLAVWVMFGVVVLSGLAALQGRVSERAALVAALGVAAAWLASPQHRRFLRACHRTLPLPLRGSAATAGDARFGLHHGLACLGACWPLMLVMAVVLHQTLLWMVVLTVVAAGGRQLRRGERAAAPLALGFATFALVFLLG